MNILTFPHGQPYQTPQERAYECVSRVLTGAYINYCETHGKVQDMRVFFAFAVVGQQMRQNTPSNAGVKN